MLWPELWNTISRRRATDVVGKTQLGVSERVDFFTVIASNFGYKERRKLRKEFRTIERLHGRS